MKIAIHHRKGSFSDYWLDYCAALNVDTKLVDCYASDIVSQIEECDALMWHFHHASSRDVLFAKQLMYSLETSGKIVFPDFHTCWFFDDKVGQKYLLESIGAPLISSYVFYEKHKALKWVKQADFPKVFKLRRGASSSHVELVCTRQDALKIVRKAFRTGFPQYEAVSNLKERWRQYRAGQTGLEDVLKGVIRFGYTTDFDRVAGRERGYVYFQDFIPDKKYDLRVIVIGEKAFGIKRNTRPGDFRASGSGFIEYEKHHFDEKTIRYSFELAKKLNSKALAIDYVYDRDPYIVEINFGFDSDVYEKCRGYWDCDLNWHGGSIHPQNWMVDLVLEQVKGKAYSGE